EAHFLESWSDAHAADGTVRIGQPLLDSELVVRSPLQIVAKLAGMAKQQPRDIVRGALGLADDKAWRKAVHDGFTGQAAQPVVPDLQTITDVVLPKPGGLEIMFEVDPALYDGRFANNGWLQE